KELLRRYYLQHGYADFNIESAVAELSPDRKHFFVTFTLSEGERYKVGSVNIDSRIPEVDAEALKSEVLMKPGDWYNSAYVERTVVKLTEAVANMQSAFADARPGVERSRNDPTVALNFVINEGARVYVERI